MSLFDSIGTIVGGVGGFAIGGPAGAAIGASIGGTVDATRAAGKARRMDRQALAEMRALLDTARQQEIEALMAGNAEAAAAIREAVANQLAIYDDLIDNQHPERLAALREWFREAKAPYEPYHETGINALQQQANMLGIAGPDGTARFDPDIITTRPSYQFVLDEGLRATDRAAAARSGALGGRAVREMERYGAGLASQEFQNEFARLGDISGMGLEAAGGISRAALATQSQVNQAYSDLYRVMLGKAGVFGDEGEAMANLALSEAEGLIGISQNQTNALLGLTGADLQSRQNELNREQSAMNNLINTGITLGTIYGTRKGTRPRTTSGGGQDFNF